MIQAPTPARQTSAECSPAGTPTTTGETPTPTTTGETRSKDSTNAADASHGFETPPTLSGPGSAPRLSHPEALRIVEETVMAVAEDITRGRSDRAARIIRASGKQALAALRLFRHLITPEPTPRGA